MRPLDLLVEQLWAPAMGDDAVRVSTGAAGAGWLEHESYWMFPTTERAALLLPVGPRRVTAAAATSYRGLRRPTKNLGRSALGAVARSGLPVAPGRLRVSVSSGHPEAADGLPLPVLARALGVPRLYAATGVRAGANRKATLHLFAESGSPIGYAKVGWNEITDRFVTTEAAALRDVGGRAAPMRAPAVLAEVDYHGHRIVVTEPLPLDVRGARSRSVAPPSAQELYALCPVCRHDRPSRTGHFVALQERLLALVDDPVAGDSVQAAAPLVDRLRGRDAQLPVTARWHGDLTPWNRARDATGQLWVWDWESSEADAVAGLDALHWEFSVKRGPTGQVPDIDLPGWVAGAAPQLRAAGVRPERWGDVAAIYALTVVERAADLARRSGGWQRVWIGPDQLRLLVAQATALVTAEESGEVSSTS